MPLNLTAIAHQHPDNFACEIKPKYRYASIDEAWISAWLLWARGVASEPTTPYCCIRHAGRLYVAEARAFPNPNPWAWAPAIVVRYRIRRITHVRKPCKGWHLTRSTRHILPRGTTSRQISD